MRVPPLLLVLACGLAPAREAAAQSHLPVSVETSVGVAVGSGGTYVARGAAAIEAVVAHRPALGVRALVDVATRPWRHTALVASLRHAVLPSFRDEAVGITSVGFGLRIQ